MADEARYQEANHYTFEGPDVSGIIDTSSISGQPTGSVSVDDNDAQEVIVERGPLGWTGTAPIDEVEDGYSRSVTIILPAANVEGDSEIVEGLAIIVTHRTSIGGPALVKGALELYDTRPISGAASSVQA